MTSGLPVVSGREAIRVFERLGYSVCGSAAVTSGCSMRGDPSSKLLTIPDHRTLNRDCCDT
jgi:hypothetical protein